MEYTNDGEKKKTNKREDDWMKENCPYLSGRVLAAVAGRGRVTRKGQEAGVDVLARHASVARRNGGVHGCAERTGPLVSKRSGAAWVSSEGEAGRRSPLGVHPTGSQVEMTGGSVGVERRKGVARVPPVVHRAGAEVGKRSGRRGCRVEGGMARAPSGVHLRGAQVEGRIKSNTSRCTSWLLW